MFHNKNPKSFVFNFWGSLQVRGSLFVRGDCKVRISKKNFSYKVLAYFTHISLQNQNIICEGDLICQSLVHLE